MTTSLSPRGGQAGSPGSESRNKPQRQWKEEALCQVLLLAGGCWFPWQRDAEAAGGGAWLRWGGPGRSRQIPSRCSQRWDFQGSTWNPAVKPSCLVKASTALLGNARNLLSTRAGVYREEVRSRKTEMMYLSSHVHTPSLSLLRNILVGLLVYRVTVAVAWLAPVTGSFVTLTKSL